MANICFCEWRPIGAQQVSRGVPAGLAQRPTPKADAAYPVRINSKPGTQTWSYLLNKFWNTDDAFFVRIGFLTRSPTTEDAKGGLDCKPSTEAKHVLIY